MAGSDWAIPGLGLVGDLASASMQARATRQAAEIQARAVQAAIDARKAAGDEAKGFYDPYMDVGPQALQDYQEMDVSVDPGTFSWKKDDGSDYGVQDFLDPSMQYQQEQARKQLEASAAAGGPGLRSGAFAKGLQTQAEKFAQTDFNNAWTRMSGERDFSYKDYIDNYNLKRTQVQDEINRVKEMINTGKWATTGKGNAVTGTAQDVGEMLQTQGAVNSYGAAAGPTQGAASVEAITDPTLWTSMFGGGGSKPKTAEEKAAEASATAAGYGTPSTQRTWPGGQGGSGGSQVSTNLGPITG